MLKNPKFYRDRHIPINPALVWEYDVPPEQGQTEAFRSWYLGRVLTRGSSEDLKAIGLDDYWLALALQRVELVELLPRMIRPVEIDALRRFFLDQAEKLIRKMGPEQAQ